MSHLWHTLKSSISALRYSEDQYGRAFLIASDTGDIEKMLAHIGTRGVCYQDEYGQRPLHRASRRGHAAAVRVLLEHGSDPNACDHVGAYTAIQYAAHYQHSEVVRLLVSYGADVYYQNRIACRPATYYAHKYPAVKRAIEEGTTDLYIHRSIAASFLMEHLDTHFAMLFHSQTLKHSIAMKIIECLPRHQLWTQVKTRYITNNTTNWHSSDLFSEKHLEVRKKNMYHSCKYHGEFDIDKDWDTRHSDRTLADERMYDSSSSEHGDYDEDDEDEEYDDGDHSEHEEKYSRREDHKGDDEEEHAYYSNTSQTSKSLSSDDDNDDVDNHRNVKRVTLQPARHTIRKRRRRRQRNNRYHHRMHAHRRNHRDHHHHQNAVDTVPHSQYLRMYGVSILLLLLSVLIVFIAMYFKDYREPFTQIIGDLCKKLYDYISLYQLSND